VDIIILPRGAGERVADQGLTHAAATTAVKLLNAFSVRSISIAKATFSRGRGQRTEA
jgi:hypothetical protein